jgi:simple sugar transport system ATP-binding protein
MVLFGQEVGHWPPQSRRELGLHFVPEERLGRGAVPELSLSQNLLLTRKEAVSPNIGWLNMKSLQVQAQTIIDRFHVKASGPNALAKSLSGGNLQKFLVGREIDASPQLLIISQPTWGVDIGACDCKWQAFAFLDPTRGPGQFDWHMDEWLVVQAQCGACPC